MFFTIGQCLPLYLTDFTDFMDVSLTVGVGLGKSIGKRLLTADSLTTKLCQSKATADFIIDEDLHISSV